MKKVVFTFLSLLLICTFNVKAQSVNGVIVSDVDRVTVVKVWGNHYERGYAYGYLCGEKINSVYEDFILPNYGTILPLAKAIIGDSSNFTIDQIYIDEAQGIIDGMGTIGIDTAGITYLDLFVFNFSIDLENFSSLKGLRFQNCSSLMDWGDATTGTDLDGRSVLTHHLDANQLDSAIVYNQVVVVHFPSEVDEQPWLLTGIAGQMVTSQAVNNSGTGTFLNTVNGFDASFGQGYEPVTLAIRKGVEKQDYNSDGYHNVNDIRDALSSNTNGYAGGFIVCALSPSTEIEDSLIALVVELAPVQPYITYRTNSYSDSIDGDNLYAANAMIKRNNANDYCSRYQNVSNEIHNMYNGIGIGSQDNWDIMRTQSFQTINLQAMQYIPEDRIFSISARDETTPAYDFTPQVFDLDDLFLLNGNVQHNVDNQKVYSIFPNPAEKSIVVYASEPNTINRLEISDINGRSFKILNFRNKAIVDVTSFPSGIYFVSITIGDESFTEKIVVE